MNETMVKILGAFLVGGACGSVVTYILLDKKYAKRTEDEVASMREYVNRVKECEAAQNYITPEDVGLSKEDVNMNISMLTKGATTYKPGSLAGTADIDYAGIADRLAENEHPSEEDDEYYHYANLGEARGSEVIDAGEMEALPQYDKVILYYYTYNNILTYGELSSGSDETLEVIEDEDGILGEAWDESGFTNVDDERDVLYIRNHDRSTDYEIQKIFSAYQIV